MAKFAVFDDQGFVKEFYSEEVHGAKTDPDTTIPNDAVGISDHQWLELLGNPSTRKWLNGGIVEYTPPQVDQVIVIPAVALWERLTEAEAEQVNAAMAAQPFRTRQIFLTANTFRSDHELWPLLMQMATDLFGEERAAELLSPA